MKNKKAATLEEAVSYLRDGATVLIGGFGYGGVPENLIEGICGRSLRELTIVNNNSGTGHTGIARLLEEGCVGKMICTFPFAKESHVFQELYAAGKVDLEVVPQGTLAERMRNAGAGLGGFLTPTGVGTEIAEGKPEFEFDGRKYILEKPLHADFGLIKAFKTDPRGNLIYRKAARNFNPVIAMAADFTIAEVAEEVALGDLDPECVVTPGTYVDCYYATGG
jgi:3-oxoadipate CoA-transferase alpha subunit